MDKVPIVSICCITYNHAPYIRQCLDGFLMQKTNFAFEVLIHDDCSTDGTTEIIKEYEKLHPEIIRAIYEEENQWVKGRRGSALFNYPRAKGKYIAMCEGDDYWIDPLKLQKQVDFLENNSDYSMCFARAMEHYEDGSKEDKLFSLVDNRDYDGVEFYEDWIIPTATVLFRVNVLESVVYKSAINSRKFIHGDIVLFLSCAACGKVRGCSDVFSIYRRHIGGATFVRTVQMSRLLIQHSEYTPIVFGKQYSKTAKKRVAEFALQGFVDSKFRDWSMFKKSFVQNPKCTIRQIVKILCNKLRK